MDLQPADARPEDARSAGSEEFIPNDCPPPKKRYCPNLTTIISVFLVVIVMLAARYSIDIAPDSEITLDSEATLISIDDVAELRELDIHEEVTYTYMTEEELRVFLNSSTDIDDFEDMRKLFESFFLWNPGDDLAEAYLARYSSTLLGYYSHESRSMVLIQRGDSNNSQVSDNVTLVHEFTHALQDQNFNLSDYMLTATSDSHLARKAVVEGDATKVEYDYLFSLSEEELAELFAAYQDYPPAKECYVLDEIAVFPYFWGYFFVEMIYTHGGWEAVNDLYTRPPASTEQIMHIDKYYANEPPINVSYQAEVPDMELVMEDTLGEFFIYLMLGNHMNKYYAMEMAEGWGGDRYYYYENDTDFLSIFTIEWDTEDDAIKFNRACTFWMTCYPMAMSVTDNTLKLKHDGSVTTIFRSSSPELIERVY